MQCYCYLRQVTSAVWRWQLCDDPQVDWRRFCPVCRVMHGLRSSTWLCIYDNATTHHWPLDTAHLALHADCLAVVVTCRTRRRSWQCISPPSEFLQTPHFQKILRGHVWTVPGNMHNCTSNSKSVALTVLELLAFNAQKWWESGDPGYAPFKKLRGYVRTVPGNMRVKFEVRIFNRFDWPFRCAQTDAHIDTCRTKTVSPPFTLFTWLRL